MYDDQLKKINEYRVIIKQKLLQQDQYPTTSIVNSLLDKIDMRYALLEHVFIAKGADLDIDRFNYELYCLYRDLVVLFELAYDLESKKFVELEAFVNGYLKSLESLADTCEQKANLQTETTSLGKTVLFMNTGFDIEFKDDKTIINLGAIEVEAQSKLSCFIDGLGFNQDGAVFKFKQGDTILSCSPYSVNSDFAQVGGEVEVVEHKYTPDKDSRIWTNFKIPDITANDEYRYEAYAGKNQILINSSSTIIDKDVSISVPAETTVRFYIYKGKTFSIDMSVAPATKNFEEYETTSLPDVAKVEFTTDQYTSFSIQTDGEIYAEKIQVEAKNDELFVTSILESRDMIILETIPGEPVKFDNVQVILYNAAQDTLDISSIAIKQLTNVKR